MKSWAEIHGAINAIQEKTRKEFKTDITDKVMSEVVDALVEHRLSDYLSQAFGQLTTNDLLQAQEILRTDKKALEKAIGQRAKKQKGDLN